MKQPRDWSVRRFDAWREKGRFPRSSQWLRRARQLGLQEDRTVEAFTLRGKVGGVWCVVERQRRSASSQPPAGQEKLDWRWSVSMTGLQLEGRLTVSAETTMSGLAKLVTGQDILTGDAVFDGAALVRGEPAYALAVLSHNVRRTLAVALSRGVRIGADGLSWGFWDRTLPRRVLSRIRQLAVLAERLALDDEKVHAGLLRNAVRDPMPEVRRRNLQAVAGDQAVPPSPAVVQAAVAAAAADDERLVATAAGILARAVRFDAQRIDLLPEPGLCCLLRHGPSEHRLHIIGLLAEGGTSWSLGALAEAGRGLLTGRRVREAAREATGRIIDRDGGLKEGGLSLAPAAVGDLSLIPGAEAGLQFSD